MDNKIAETEYDALNKAVVEYLKTGKITICCPRCGKTLVYEIHDSMEVVHCEDQCCIKSIRKGI